MLMVNGYRRDVKHYAYGCSKFFFGISSGAPRPHADAGLF